MLLTTMGYSSQKPSILIQGGRWLQLKHVFFFFFSLAVLDDLLDLDPGRAHGSTVAVYGWIQPFNQNGSEV